jgi:acetyl esterase/lipase
LLTSTPTGPSSPPQLAFLILHTPHSHSNAAQSCSSLSETLWDPRSTNNSTESLSVLRYLDYGKDTDDVGLYWINSGNKDNKTCRTIDTHGTILEKQDCSSYYPALCSQSAPWSSPSTSDTSPEYQVSVQTGNAIITGYRDNLSFRFLGLKYGSIPARFEHSTYTAPKGNFSALSYGPPCIQSSCPSPPRCSEDCLYLNIWTPYLPQPDQKEPTKKKKGKAVLVWIHGGGFTSGTGSDTAFDGGALASRGDVVLITLNYRLSTLGFLALSSPSSDTPLLGGNFGLADQITALRWIREHVEDFGGDPDSITIFGQSAGAASVRALIASPKAKGLFQGAILMSTPGGLGYAETFSRYLSIGEAETRYSDLLNKWGCAKEDGQEVLKCLRVVDAGKLVVSETVAR